uniref:Uncharacterized protein n=1 Tax=Globisporangium ultimum (strain ATCC 200006 / CBS 805.95 / DAOM BR144) TaxID=431595 RepID=K3W842_GLOUD
MRFSLFTTQLENETSGQVRMWRLPASDSQHQRCVKAATENVKPHHPLGEGTIEVLEVYKIENRALLHHFQCFTHVLPPSEVKIKGLFCSIPTESVEHVVVWGMHADEESFLTYNGTTDIQMFNRASLVKDDDAAPGTAHTFQAKRKVAQSKALQFPRRFSRYSTLEETRQIHSGTNSASLPAAEDSIWYLALCRVAMGRTVRVKKDATKCREEDLASFPADSSVNTLYFSDE